MSRYPATQIDAWISIQDSLPSSRREVFQVISQAGEQGVSTVAIAETLHWPINCVSGRITELRNGGVVRDSGRRCMNPSGKKAILWTVVEPPKQPVFEPSGQGVLL